MKSICIIVLCLFLGACTSSTPNGTDRLASARNSSYEISNSTEILNPDGILATGTADFNGDGRGDFLKAYISGTTNTTPIKMFLQNPSGKFVEDNSLLPLPLPGTVHARKVVIADFNGDQIPDIFIVDHGYDQAPFPGAAPVLLMSENGKFEQKMIPDIPVGFQHSATAADITGNAKPDIFVTDTTNGAFLLVNDGTGNFTLTRHGIPSIRIGYYTSEFIDLDDDGYYDLLVGGHEYEGAATRIFWGDKTGKFNLSHSAVIPGDDDYGIVLDFDAEDLDGDGVRELVVTRTKSKPFYQGYYFQIVEMSAGKFADVSTRIVSDRAAWEGARSDWIAWIVLRDSNGDGFRDIVVLDKSRSLLYINDGQGNFSRGKP